MISTPIDDDARRDRDSLVFFSFTGFIVAIVGAGTWIADIVSKSRDTLSLTPEFLLVGIGCIGYAMIAYLASRPRSHTFRFYVYHAPMVLWLGALIWTSYRLISVEHNKFVVAIAVAQALAINAFFRKQSVMSKLAIAAASITGWILCANITFTPMKDWLAAASPATGLATAAFVIAFFIVLSALASNSYAPQSFKGRRIASYVIAAVIFLIASLRTDHLTTDFIPYHRSYFADIANLVRDGHWLLWDLPSQYGFLSVVTLAVLPTANAYDSIYLLTAAFLTLESFITFAILYTGQARLANYAFAILLPLGTYFCGSVTRYPFDARLYPQISLRFIWLVAMIGVAFLSYTNRVSLKTVHRLRITGFALWALALFWSFETGVWATIVWLAYVVTELVVDIFLAQPMAWCARLKVAGIRLVPFVVIGAVGILCVQVFYVARLGHAPDLLSYVEFTAVYTADPLYHIVVDRQGPAWSMALLLGAIGTVAIVSIRQRRFEQLPAIATAWFATWVAVSYWIGESYDNHVVAVYTVAIPSAAVAIFLSREALASSSAARLARLSLAPIAVTLIALMFGEPTRTAAILAPPMPSWSLNSMAAFPTVSGELEQIMKRAHIQTSDRVLFPTEIAWTKLGNGFILPFYRSHDGSLHEYHSWLPLSPQGASNTFGSLDFDRRRLYIDRSLDRFRGSAWFITYREEGGCRLISPRLHTIRSRVSANFTASLCALSQQSRL